MKHFKIKHFKTKHFKTKHFKDPIYGYINIPQNIVEDIIDTPSFQRLRYIKQTSYTPVYSAALHNRFVHSLGVYFLGQKACQSLIKNATNILNEFSFRKAGFNVRYTFELACLLHDVGHAPFSHSGEDFFIDEKKSLYNDLKKTVGNSDFSNDVDFYHKNAKPAAAHEIMSVIVSLVQYNSFFKGEEDRDFFARCITGYKYRDTEKNTLHAIFNAFISLLNSNTIDVDRLDYLIRDAFVMGYKSISIDYNRLLDSLTLIKVQNPADHTPIQLAYKKAALSVIENVIYAHDSEKKWIQNHPVILYEVYLIQRIIDIVQAEYKKATKKELFSLESILPINRPSFPNGISLLCDDDIVHMAKQIDHPICSELFNRYLRRHPVWKSESEYKIFVDGFVGDSSNPLLYSRINLLDKFIKEEVPSYCIGDEALAICEKRLKEVDGAGISEDDKKDMKHRYESLLKWITAFKELSTDGKLKNFNFIIIPTSKFESGFKKKDLGNVPIYFSEIQKSFPLEQLINLFSVKDDGRKKYFYIYYQREKGETLDPFVVGKRIAKLILE